MVVDETDDGFSSVTEQLTSDDQFEDDLMRDAERRLEDHSRGAKEII